MPKIAPKQSQTHRFSRETQRKLSKTFVYSHLIDIGQKITDFYENVLYTHVPRLIHSFGLFTVF